MTDKNEATGRLLVIGAGTMGAQLALQAATNGVEVELVDPFPEALEKGGTQLRALLDSRVTRGKVSQEQANATLGRIQLSGDLAAAASKSDWVIEAAIEKIEVKKVIFADLAAALPAHAGIATNSSHIRAETIAGGSDFADRILNMHFFHPVAAMDLVEIVSAPTTSPEIMQRAAAWACRIGRAPVIMNKAVDGFLVNRVLGAASREAFALLADGVADFAEIDVAVRNGLNWPLGPFQLADLSGLDLLLLSRTARFERLGEAGDRATMEVVAPLVEAGRLGRKSGAGFYDYSTDPPAPLPLVAGGNS